MSSVEIYTDGACRGNPGPGGWGATLEMGEHFRELSGAEAMTTNNRMELLSVILALETLKFPGSKVTVFSDSRYVVDAIEKGWIKGWIKKNWKVFFDISTKTLKQPHLLQHMPRHYQHIFLRY